MKNLTDYVKIVYSTRGLNEKRKLAEEMVQVSHAKTERKRLAMVEIARLRSEAAVDKFVTNYMLSGEGMKV